MGKLLPSLAVFDHMLQSHLSNGEGIVMNEYAHVISLPLMTAVMYTFSSDYLTVGATKQVGSVVGFGKLYCKSEGNCKIKSW